ncbi:hypothetical protein WJX84_006062 [Apatococcus fuscideae]|uniref:Uncharacterized protein n=1 Tax=Apatococcus fuscideae TaxID=2026836 RepID=A0AAW1T384_9CHLO
MLPKASAGAKASVEANLTVPKHQGSLPAGCCGNSFTLYKTTRRRLAPTLPRPPESTCCTGSASAVLATLQPGIYTATKGPETVVVDMEWLGRMEQRLEHQDEMLQAMRMHWLPAILQAAPGHAALPAVSQGISTAGKTAIVLSEAEQRGTATSQAFMQTVPGSGPGCALPGQIQQILDHLDGLRLLPQASALMMQGIEDVIS